MSVLLVESTRLLSWPSLSERASFVTSSTINAILSLHFLKILALVRFPMAVFCSLLCCYINILQVKLAPLLAFNENTKIDFLSVFLGNLNHVDQLFVQLDLSIHRNMGLFRIWGQKIPRNIGIYNINPVNFNVLPG